MAEQASSAYHGVVLLGEQGRNAGLPIPDPAVFGVSNGSHLEADLKDWP